MTDSDDDSATPTDNTNSTETLPTRVWTGLPTVRTTRRRVLGGLVAGSVAAGSGTTTASTPSTAGAPGAASSHGYGAGGYGAGGYGGTTDPPDGPPPLPGQDDRPQDPDGDGIYEDVDGDGALTLQDVRLYYQEIYQKPDSTYVQNNRQYFDETGDGEISLADVHEIFEQFSNNN
jgi:hypothetical protein